MKTNRPIIIFIIFLMAVINMYLDSSTSISLILFIGMMTALPALFIYLITRKKNFKILNINPYKLSSDFIIFGTFILWIFLLFIRVRPEFYFGASHMYVITWPIIIGLIALVLYVCCFFTELIKRRLFK